MAETFKEQLERVESMANPSGSWDLSDNDMAALSALLDHYKGAQQQLTEAQATIARLSTPLSPNEYKAHIISPTAFNRILASRLAPARLEPQK